MGGCYCEMIAFGTGKSDYSCNNHQYLGSSLYKTDINTITAMPELGIEPAGVHTAC